MAKDERFEVKALGSQGTLRQGSVMATVITDSVTGVQYLLATFPSQGSGLTVLVDADGKPLQSS